MTWDEVIKEVKILLNSRDLSDPFIRLRAVSNLDDTMRRYFPNIVQSPDSLLERNKDEFKQKLARVLHKDKLNGAESSIVNNFYQILEANKFDASKSEY